MRQGIVRALAAVRVMTEGFDHFLGLRTRPRPENLAGDLLDYPVARSWKRSGGKDILRLRGKTLRWCLKSRAPGHGFGFGSWRCSHLGRESEVILEPEGITARTW